MDIYICSLQSITLDTEFVGPGNSIGYIGLAPFDKDTVTKDNVNINFMKTLMNTGIID